MTQRNVKFMTNMARMHLKKEWVEVVAAMTHLTFSNPFLVEALLEVSEENFV